MRLASHLRMVSYSLLSFVLSSRNTALMFLRLAVIDRSIDSLLACCYLLCCGCGVYADETADVASTVTAVLGAAFGAGVPPWFSVEAIVSANIRLQLAFLSSLFRVAPGLDYESASGTLDSEVPSSSKGLGFDNAPLHGTWLFGIDYTEPCVFEQDLLQLPLPLYRNRQELLHHRVNVGFVFCFSPTVSFLGVISICCSWLGSEEQ
jgi:hypothetical protein